MISKLIYDTSLPTWALFAELFIAGAVVITAGSRFTKAADALATKLNIGGGWIGLILLATVTSLPELITGGTATWLGNVDLAFGAIFGSCCFNITLIFLLNALWRQGSILGRDSVNAMHTLSSSFGLALITIALLGIVVVQKFDARVRFAEVFELGWSGLIAVVYIACMKLIHRYDTAQSGMVPGPAPPRSPVESSLYVTILVMGVIIVAASWWLACIGDTLSVHHIELIGRPLGATFVGACFLALATSLPEIVTSIAAVRLGNLDLALGNIFGSNMFNIFVIPSLKLISLAKGESQLLGAEGYASDASLIAGLLAILLTAIAVGGLAYKSKRRMLRGFGVDSMLILLTYLGGMALLLMNGGSPEP